MMYQPPPSQAYYGASGGYPPVPFLPSGATPSVSFQQQQQHIQQQQQQQLQQPQQQQHPQPLDDIGSRKCFVGNLPFDVTEQQIVEFLSSVGPVTAWRAMIDRETGKSKGFGFVEYRDAATAASAKRNLHGQEFHGRSIRIDNSDQDVPGGAAQRRRELHQQQPASRSAGDDDTRKIPLGSVTTIGSQATSSGPGAILSSAMQSSNDAISRLIRNLSRQQCTDILTETKKFVTQNPEGARQLFIDSPAIAQALLQMELLFGLVKPHDISSLERTHSTAQSVTASITAGNLAHHTQPQQQAAPLTTNILPQPHMSSQPPPGMPAPPIPSYSQGYPPQTASGNYGMPGYGAPPPQHMAGYGAPQPGGIMSSGGAQHMQGPLPPQPGMVPPPVPLPPGLSPHIQALLAALPPPQQELLRSVISLSREDFEKMTPDRQQHVLKIQRELGLQPFR